MTIVSLQFRGHWLHMASVWQLRRRWSRLRARSSFRGWTELGWRYPDTVVARGQLTRGSVPGGSRPCRSSTITKIFCMGWDHSCKNTFPIEPQAVCASCIRRNPESRASNLRRFQLNIPPTSNKMTHFARPTVTASN